MNAERSIPEKQSVGASFLIPESIRKAFEEVRPEGVDWERIQGAMEVLKGEKVAVAPKPPEPEPTESQKFWRKMFDTEDSSYARFHPMDTQLLQSEFQEFKQDPVSFVKNLPKHIRAVDAGIRGRDIGGAKERAQRVATMAGVISIFTAFDYLTSKPIQMAQKKWFPKIGGDPRLEHNARIDLVLKLTEVLNDKLATAYGDILVRKLTGKAKASFTTEPTDKLADVGNVAFEDFLEDLVNGPNLEAGARILYQLPVYGALIEQGVSAVARLQGKDGVSKGVGKAIFMSVGKYIYQRRGLGMK